jgi:membrane protein DedA with SNARE-associated domain
MTFVMTALAHFTYVALIGILIIAGTGMPIPEDLPLIFSGYVCNEEYSPIKGIPRWVDLDGDGTRETAVPRKIPDFRLMMIAGIIGVLAGDSIVFSIGKHGIESKSWVARHLRKVMHSKRREKVERHFARHGNLTVFVGRFMPGFRGIIFAFAGLSKMSYLRFVLIDGMAAGISVPVFVYAGYHFAAHIHVIFTVLDRIKLILLPVVVLALLVGIAIYYLRRRRTPAAIQNI